MKKGGWRVMVGVCLAIATLAAAQDKYAALSRYAGQYPDRQFFTRPEIAQPLDRLLGKNAGQFRSFFQITFPIGIVGSDLVAEGCVRHECAARRAAFAIDLQTGNVSAASLVDHSFTIYSRSGNRYLDLDPGLRMWISRVTDEAAPRSMQFSFVK